MFERFKRKPVAPARVHTVEAAHVKAYHRGALKDRGLRKAMWVNVDGRVGILTGYTEDHCATVMLVNEDGKDVLPIVCQGTSVRQAFYAEIPAARRPADRELARLNGYA